MGRSTPIFQRLDILSQENELGQLKTLKLHLFTTWLCKLNQYVCLKSKVESIQEVYFN